jgi:hypothetical protein
MRTNTNKHKRHRDGRYHFEEPVEDGGEVRVPMLLCDTAGHRPGHWVSPLSDAEVRDLDRLRRLRERAAVVDAREEMIARARSAWRDGRRKVDPDEDDEEDDDEANLRHESPSVDARAAAVRARDAYVASLGRAWQMPTSTKNLIDVPAVVTGPGAAATRPSPRAGKAPKRPVPPPQDPQARRDLAYSSYAASLSEAWKTPPGLLPPQPVSIGAGVSSHVRAAGEIAEETEAWKGA